MVDLSERGNGLWGRERGDRANIEYTLRVLTANVRKTPNFAFVYEYPRIIRT